MLLPLLTLVSSGHAVLLVTTQSILSATIIMVQMIISNSVFLWNPFLVIKAMMYIHFHLTNLVVSTMTGVVLADDAKQGNRIVLWIVIAAPTVAYLTNVTQLLHYPHS